MKDGKWFASDEVNTFQAMPIYPSHWCELPEVPDAVNNKYKSGTSNLLPNWVFKVGYNHKGELNYEVNGAFMYLSSEEIDKFRATIVEAIYQAEKFYRSTHPDPLF